MRQSSVAIWTTIACLSGWPAPILYAQGYPDLPFPFIRLSDVAPTIQQDIRYATINNFLGRPAAGYLHPECILTRKTAMALLRVQQTLRTRNYSLRVYDCYRPTSAVSDFVKWSQSEDESTTKNQYYPNSNKRDLFSLGYIAARSMHSRGNTVDVTIVSMGSAVPEFNKQHRSMRCDAPANERAPANSLDFGTGFDCFDLKSHTWSTQIPKAALENRRLLVSVMESEGFRNYTKEWWHFELPGAETTDAFNFVVRKRSGDAITAEGDLSIVPQASSGCAHKVDSSNLFTVDCNERTVNIVVLKDVISRTALGRIVEYDPFYVSHCECSIQPDTDPAGAEWCKVQYIKTVQEEFDGWVLFSALKNPIAGRPPICKRARKTIR